MDRRIAIGVDIGGSHISCAAVDLLSREILPETVTGRPVDSQAEAGTILVSWGDALNEVLERIDINQFAGIGFAMPGPFDYLNGISQIKGVSKFEKLYGVNVGKEIASILRLNPEFPVRFMNDASSFAVGEAWGGETKGYSRSMAITLGTGFGSAFIHNGIPVVEGPDVPRLGCVYYLPFLESIADDYFSTRWFAREYLKTSGRSVSGVKEIAQLAQGGDELALALFYQLGSNLATFLSPYLKSFGAEALVLGGNISQSWHLFGHTFESHLREADCTTELFTTKLGEDSALVGSACLLDEQFYQKVKDILPLM